MQQNTLPVGTVIRTSNRDRYMVERLLGKGGLSAIYLVRDQRVKQNRFALKEVKNPSRREREHFLFECEVLKRLDHQALPRVYRVFEDPEHNQAYVLMDYIEGPNLELLRRQQLKQRFSVPQVLSMMGPIMDAVAFLHNQSPPVIHRDIKPSNIIVPATGDDAVLVDFSIAKAYASEETTTAVGQGTPGYAAPEQYGMGTTPRTDIYGLGATVYTLLTGTTPADALYRMLRTSENEPDPLVPVDQVTPAVPKEIAEAVHRALSLSSKARFSTVQQFWQALHGKTAEQDIHPSRAVSPTPPDTVTPSSESVKSIVTISHPGKRHSAHFMRRGVLLLVLVALLTGVGMGAHALLSAASSQDSPPALRIHTLHPGASAATATATLAQDVYPPLAERYSGTIASLGANTKTDMTLSGVQQGGGNFRGYFTGLGVSGPFQGTVATSDHVQFQVTVYSGNATIAFEGTIQFGGNIAGSYQILNQEKQFTGESGVWSVSPVLSG